MTSPEGPEESIGDDARDSPSSGLQRAAPYPAEREEFWALGWAKALWGGVQDTAHDVLDAGRKGASEAYDEGWQRFDQKTRLRRHGAVANKAKKRKR